VSGKDGIFVQKVYEQLLHNIKEGKPTAMISKYQASGIVKSLASEDDRYIWNSLGESCLSVFESGAETTMIEYYTPKPRLIILGGGHIALPLSSFGAKLGFHVVVFDDRPSFANTARFSDAQTVICDGFANINKRLNIIKNDYIVIVTRGHRHDALCLREILEGEFPCYVGMIGSKRRVEIVKRQLEEETGAVAKLDQLHAPVGLPIGAVTPEEIALSILAEIVQVKRLGAFDGENKVRYESYPDMELLEWLAKRQTEEAALETVVSTDGSTPREIGAKMAVLAHGPVIGSIGGGCAEAEVIQKARNVMQNGAFCVMDIDMTDSAEEDGMVCGGIMKVLIEKI